MALRELYDNFLKNAEVEFFDVLKEIWFPNKSTPVLMSKTGLPSQPQIEQPLDYGADNEHSLRSSGINIDTRGRMEIPSEVEGILPSNKDSHEIRLSACEQSSSDSPPEEEMKEEVEIDDPF